MRSPFEPAPLLLGLGGKIANDAHLARSVKSNDLAQYRPHQSRHSRTWAGYRDNTQLAQGDYQRLSINVAVTRHQIARLLQKVDRIPRFIVFLKSEWTTQSGWSLANPRNEKIAISRAALPEHLALRDQSGQKLGIRIETRIIKRLDLYNFVQTPLNVLQIALV